MKKSLLSIVALSVLATSAHAQKLYCRAGLGYAVSQAGQSIAGNEWPYSGTVRNGVTYDIRGASFSAGIQGFLALGYMFNKNVGIQVDAQIGLASKDITFANYDVNVSYGPGASVLSNIVIIQHAKLPINLVPALVVRTAGDPWDIYCRMGVALPVYSVIEKANIITNASGTGAASKRIETWKVKNSFAPGLSAAAGFEYKMNPYISVWAEVSVLSMSLFIKEADLTDYNYNGQSINLSQLSGTKSVTYSKTMTLDTAGYTVQPAYTQPFSNVGLNVGVRRTFGGARKRNGDDAEDRRKHRRY